MSGNSEGAKKGQETKSKIYSEEQRTAWGIAGGKKKTRGYFGYLKEHDPAKLKEISIRNKRARDAKKKQS